MKTHIRERGGYAAEVRCGMNHSGNDRLARLTAHTWQCQGCGKIVYSDALLAVQRGPVGGQKGSGGIYRIEAQ